MVSGRFVLNVSGRKSTIEPESTEIPPNSMTGSDGIRRACKITSIYYHAIVFTASAGTYRVRKSGQTKANIFHLPTMASVVQSSIQYNRKPHIFPSNPVSNWSETIRWCTHTSRWTISISHICWWKTSKSLKISHSPEWTRTQNRTVLPISLYWLTSAFDRLDPIRNVQLVGTVARPTVSTKKTYHQVVRNYAGRHFGDADPNEICKFIAT